MPTGAQLLVRTIRQLGISEVFTLVGDHLNEVLLLMPRTGIRVLDMRHESGVTHAADAWARIQRRPSVSIVTGGPGHTNSLTGIAAASLACSPVISISGARPSNLAERGAFQDIDQIGMVRPIVKWAAQPPSPSLVPFYLGRAWAEANSGRKGPVHLTIPLDVLTGATDYYVPASPALESTEPQPDSGQIGNALSVLQAAKRPVVIAGAGIWWANAESELRDFIERTSLPLYTISMARGTVSDDHPLSMGYADPAINRAAHHAFLEADVVLVLGKRIDHRLGMGGIRIFAPDARFIQVDIHPQELGLNRELAVSLCAGVKATLQAFLAEIGTALWAPLPWLDRLQLLRSEWAEMLGAHAQQSGTPLHPATFFAELKKYLPPNALYAWDGGDFVHWGRCMLPALRSGGWMRLGPLGAIGSALPHCLALKLAHPDDPVVLFTGDGSLGFYLAELDTAVRHDLPVIVVVGNDSGWGLERELQNASGGASVACELRQTRYEMIMRGFGGEGELVDELAQVHPAIERALQSRVPYCLNVVIRGSRSPFTDWQVAARKVGS
jgi:acetolactate synthase I/II/III large subunit